MTPLTPTEKQQLAEMLPDKLAWYPNGSFENMLVKIELQAQAKMYGAEVLPTEIPYLVSMVEEGLSEKQFKTYHRTLWNTWYRNEAVSSIIFNPLEHWLIRLTPQTRIACLWRVVGKR